MYNKIVSLITDTTCYKTEKRGKKVSIHMHDTLKTKCEEKLKKKRKQQKTVLTGLEPTSTKIEGSLFIYILKTSVLLIAL